MCTPHHRILAVWALLLGLTAGFLPPVMAAEHLMAIQEVFPGTLVEPAAQYVMLRMTSSGQTFVNGTYVELQDATGAVLGRFGTFDHNVLSGGVFGCAYPGCPAILIGTTAAQSLLGFPFDQTVDSQAGRRSLPLMGGRACFRSTFSVFDCVAWGSFGGTNTIANPGNLCDTNFGAPAAPLSPGFALTRKQFSCASKENSLDFENRFPHPVANSGMNANSDGDQDGLIDVLDCADGDTAALYFPAPISGLAVTGPPTLVSWEPQDRTSGSSTLYDVVRGGLLDLRGSRSYELADCMQNDQLANSTADPGPDPPEGDGVYYLARAANNCGPGSYGNSSLIPDPRDFLDDPIKTPCP
ncbi:MAG: hypothetical protein HY510_03680 [Acidobacteria bacterium]|nr:hypothetical protein [Acidobacteriota bacterium]